MKHTSINHRYTWQRGLALCACVATGCTQELESPVHWTAIDAETIVDAIENPTAAITDSNLQELNASILGNQTRIFAINRLVTDGLETSDMPIKASIADFPQRPMIPETVTSEPSSDAEPRVDLPGTTVFLRVACPGPGGIQPDPDFRYGHIRLDSQSLSEATTGVGELEGHVLATFDACQTDLGLIEGQARITYAPDSSVLVVVPEITVRDQPDSAPDFDLDFPYVATPEWVYRLLELPNLQTLTIGFAATPIETPAAVYGVDGRVFCRPPPDDPSCTAELDSL